MAKHKNLASLSIEVIDEYLTTARVCLDYRKADGGCLGYPAVLILFCTIEAFGRYHLPKTKKPFEVLNDPLFGKNYSPKMIENVAAWYRHLLAHSATIAPGVVMTQEAEGDPIDFEKEEPIRLRVISLFQMVKSAWDKFDRSLIQPETQLEKKHLPQAIAPGHRVVPIGSSRVPITPDMMKKFLRNM